MSDFNSSAGAGGAATAPRTRPDVTLDSYVETDGMRGAALERARREIASTNVPEINLSKEEVVSIGFQRNPDGTVREAEHTHAVVTFLTPAFGQQCPNNTFGLKIYGAYCSNEEALEAAGKIRDYHTELYGKPIFGIIVVEMGKILPFPTTREQLNEVMSNKQASDESLNEMISNYRIEQQKAQILFDDRKNALVNSQKEFVREQKELSALERARQLRAEAAEAAQAAEASTGAELELEA
jgi:hypothetical protein